MRGIAGVIRFDSSPLRREEIESMTRTMAIGPTDRSATWCDGQAGLGHLMQFFFPDDARETQPLVERDGTRVLITDARLDNRAELAAAFGWSGDEAAPRPDSAFVLAAHEKWGEACASHLSGSFAFALWQPRQRRLTCGIDPLGLRPLYYFRRGPLFAFATTLRGLFVRPEISRTLNQPLLAEVAVGLRRPSAETLYRDVSRLQGGHTLVADADGVHVARYWNPSAKHLLQLPTDRDYEEAFRGELKAAVRRAIARTPGEVALFLSGGLDSSAVAVVASEVLAEQGRRLHAIHLLPRGENRYATPGRQLDESHFARAVQAHRPEIDFHFVPSYTESEPIECWDEFFSDHGVPFRGLPGLPNPALETLLERLNIGVTLDGRGGNFLVSPETIPTGYLTHLAFTGRLVAWWRELNAHREVYRRPRPWLVRHSTLDAARSGLGLGHARVRKELQWLNPDFRARTGIAQTLARAEASWAAPPVSLRRRFHRLLVEEMAQQSGSPRSVITRWPTRRVRISPLADVRLSEFCVALPFRQQFRDGWDRRLLRAITRGALPDVVRLRTTRGIAQPEFQQHFARMEPRLRSEFARLADSRSVRAYLNYDFLRAQWEHIAPGFWGGELTLVNALAFGCFLRWHERQESR